MPAWLLSALALIGRTTGLGVRGAGMAGRIAVPLAAGAGGAFLGQELAEGDGLFGDPEKKRRRRRKALTADDLRLALTIASAISKKAAENFILTRVRSG